MSNGDKQRAMREWLSPHVLACASELVHELAQTPEYMDDLMEVCGSRDDWQSPAEEEGYCVAPVTCNRDNSWAPALSEPPFSSWIYYRADEGLQAALQAADVDDRINQNSAQDTWRAACEDNNLDPYQDGAYEHWIVSRRFAERLREKGEMVTDFLGLTIWGRTCTGQAIFLDGIVEEIYDDIISRAEED